jgi:carbohydrate binding protein with CBM4/9 domain
MKKILVATLLWGVALTIFPAIIKNGDFEHGLKGWWYYPKKTKNVKIIDSGSPHGKYLLLAPENTNLGINSYNLPIGTALKPDKNYIVSFQLKIKNLKKGVAAASLIFFHKNKKVCKQQFLHSIKPGTTTDWKNYSVNIGKGTRFSIPPEAAYAIFRVSFWDRSGKCQGAIMVDNIKITETVTAKTIKVPEITVTDVGIIKSRHEQKNGQNFYWIEAEDMVPKAAYLGSWKYRNTWNYRKYGMPNDSMEHSLVRPLTKTAASATAAIKCQPGQYHLWLRIGTFRPWKKQTVSVTVNGKKFTIAAKTLDRALNKAFTWIKISKLPLKVGKKLTLTVSNNPNPTRMKVLDCFLLTSDLQYQPRKQLPPWEYFTALPYDGPAFEADFWHPRHLETPIYICRNSAQQFLIRLRNYSDTPLKNFKIELILPADITLLDPSRKLRWQGDGKKFNHPHFIGDSPSSIEHKIININGKKFNRYNLVYTEAILPYDPCKKVMTLTFLTLQAGKTIRPGKYQAIMRPFDSAGKWLGATITQELDILPELKGITAPRYNWGVDAIYAAFLSPHEQNMLLKTFDKGGVNLWASRVREQNPLLAARNREHWQRVKKMKNMRVVNWSEWFWPGSPYTDESLKYCKKYPEALGVWRNDDRGKSLIGKLICPSYLLSSKSSYLEKHMESACKLLKASGITEYLEDVEYSSPLSYCFCERCKNNFAKFSKIAYNNMKDLDGDQIIKQYRKQWVAFRTHQNTQLVDKLSTIVYKLYPQLKFKLFCGYQSWGVKNRYGVDWEQLLKLPHVAGAYIGGGMPGTAEQINQTMQWSQKNNKEFLSMGNATLSFPHGYDEMGTRDQAYLEARIIHDIMSGSGGLFIWWWGTLDGRCLKAFETGSKLAAKYGDIMLDGAHKYRQVGLTKDFSLLTSSNKRGTLICLANPSRHAEDRVLNPEAVMTLFPKKQQILNALTGKYETFSQISKRVAAIYRKGDVSLWFIPNTPQVTSPTTNWPREILADIGDLQIRLESRSFWTLYRIDYQGTRLGIDIFGSHYGHVAKYPGVGFIGSGHTENDKEQLENLKLYIDGLPVTKPAVDYKCNSIKLVKKSKIGNLLLNSEISVTNGRIIEDLKITAVKPEKLDYMYLFMHPWTTSFSDFAVLDKGNEMNGKFTDSKKFMVDRPVKCITLFNQKLNKGIITCITAIPDDIKWKNRYWDVPKRYRKHYLMAFIKKTLKPGKTYHFRAVTMPFDCNRKNWIEQARKLQKKIIY